VPKLSVLGVPTSAGSYAAGQDQAPRALRAAGLIQALLDVGLDTIDAGDLTEQIWGPDREHPYAQNLDQVVASVRELADRVPDLLDDDRRVLVIGGNCTIALGLLAGAETAFGEACALLYIDRHFDLNTPTSTIEGALDWMGLGHALDLPGGADALAGAFHRRPLLTPNRLALLGTDPTQATDFERAQVDELAVHVTTQTDLVADPRAAAAAAIAALPATRFVVHVDVDVLDFVDAPLAENTSGRNIGPTLDQLCEALSVAVQDPRWRGLSIGEINPTRSAGDLTALPRFVTSIAAALASAP
jgi:arginase